MKLREEFVLQACKEGANISELCRRFGISRKTAYKYLTRYREQGIVGLEDQSRKRLIQPFKTPASMEALILEQRRLHPQWGARKLKKVLENEGVLDIPGTSTITRVLERHNLLRPQDEMKTKAWNFFEHEHPNDLWQMDFKGRFQTAQGHCHPLTVIDDHSRFAITLNAYENQQGKTVKAGLIETFRRYGLPRRINVDNGPPWGTAAPNGYTALGIWLIRIGVQISHSRPYHPQTNGKDERFHRTLNAEVLQGRYFAGIDEVQEAFDEWRYIYNAKRPHQALGMDTPIHRYVPSARAYPETLPEIEYSSNDIVRVVNSKGFITLTNVAYYISEGLSKEHVALRPTLTEGVYEVFYCTQKIKTIDLTVTVK